MMNKHTFIICAYKESPYLETCIKSLLSQTIKSKVVVATSTPNESIKKLTVKYGLEYIVNPEGEKGIGYDFDFALKTGMEIAEYVTIAHQDDTYKADYVKKITEKMDKDTIMAFSHYYEGRDSGIVKSNTNLQIKKILLWILQFKIFQKSKIVRRRILGFGNPICCPAVTFQSNKARTPLFANEFKSNVDWFAWEQLSKEEGKFVYLSEALMMHRVHGESTTTEIIGSNLRGQEDLAMFRMFWPGFIAGILQRVYSLAERSNH